MEELVAKITADIQEGAVKFQNEVMGRALETWGYCKADVEKDLIELRHYRKTGLTPDQVQELIAQDPLKNLSLQGREMRKGVVAIENPDKCIECPMCYYADDLELHGYYKRMYRCRLEPEDVETDYVDLQKKPSWCPIRPMSPYWKTLGRYTQLEKMLREINQLRGQVGSECTSEDHYMKRAWEYCLDCVEEIVKKYIDKNSGRGKDGKKKER